MRNLAKLLLALLVFLSINSTSVFAEDNSSETRIIKTSAEEILFDDILYTNSTNKDQQITVTLFRVDGKSNEALEEKTFLNITNKSLVASKKSATVIPYIFSIPTETKEGTYYERVEIKLNNAIAKTVNFTFHVLPKDKTLDRVFYDQSDIKLEVVKKGIPFIQETRLKYTYINNSDYSFSPSATVIINGVTFQVENDKTLFKNDSLVKEFSIPIWNNINDVLKTKEAQSFTKYSGSEISIENQLGISILFKVVITIAISILILVLLVLLIVRAIKKKFASIKEKLSKKKS